MYQELATSSKHPKKISTLSERTAKTKWVNIWIDHQKAYVVNFYPVDDSTEIVTITSEIGTKHKTTGGTRAPNPGSSLSLTSEKNEENWRATHLKKFYQNVARAASGASRIIIMGPGVAKKDLQKVLGAKKNLAPIVEDLISIEKLSEKQLIHETKEFYIKKLQ